jgi:Tropinone reductase 1
VGLNQEASYSLCQLCQPLLAAGAKALARASAKPGNGSSGGGSGGCVDRASGGASIVFVSSVAGGPLAGRSGSLYAMSKAAINQLAKSLACEWARDGIRVNSVAPWVTLTEMGKQVRGHGQAVCGVGRAGVRCLRWIMDIMQP